MGTLNFKITDDFRAMVEHCKQHEPSAAYDAPLDDSTKVCLLLVHDQGVYLMPGIKAEGPAKYVIYAPGCHPDNDSEWYDTARNLVGGDDFGESIELTERLAGAIIAGKYSALEIELTSATMTVSFEPNPATLAAG